MTRFIAVSMRVDPTNHPDGERRDCIDQRWNIFLAACGLSPVFIPNNIASSQALLTALDPVGLVLSGGNDLAPLGGNAPERDQSEDFAIKWADDRSKPVIGVCRGMQLLAHRAGATLSSIQGHLATRHEVRLKNGEARKVNSFHTWSVKTMPDEYNVLAWCDDGVEALQSKDQRIAGMMWHPERETPFSADDIAFFSRHFGAAK